MEEIITRLGKLPGHIKGFVLEDPNGDYNVYIDKDLLQEEQVGVWLHELQHVRRRHLKDASKSVRLCEEEAEETYVK